MSDNISVTKEDDFSWDSSGYVAAVYKRPNTLLIGSGDSYFVKVFDPITEEDPRVIGNEIELVIGYRIPKPTKKKILRVVREDLENTAMRRESGEEISFPDFIDLSLYYEIA